MVWQRERRIFISSHPKTRKQGLKCVCSFKRQEKQDLEDERCVLGAETKGKV